MSDNLDIVGRLLQQHELALLDPQTRKSARIGELLSDTFVEFGSSGRVYDKTDVLSALRTESSVAYTVSDFTVRILAPRVALATYHAVRHVEPPQHTLRSSIWMEGTTGWQLVFHQGTTAVSPS
jgi:hypothetical protein